MPTDAPSMNATDEVIDIHTHILPECWPDLAQRYGYEGFVRIDHHRPGCARIMKGEKLFREVTANCWDPEVRWSECGMAGVTMQVLSTVPVMFSYWARPADGLDLSRFLNDHLAEIVKNSAGRFEGLGTVPLQEPALAIEELRRCVQVLGLRGVQIGTHVNSWNLDDAALYPFFEAAEEFGAAIFVHPWDMLGSERMTKYWLPWLVGMPAETSLAITSLMLGGVLERLPRLRIAFAHGGGAFPMTLGRMEHAFHIRPDVCAISTRQSPRSQIPRVYLDSLVHDPRVLGYLIDTFGEERIAMGSDYPFPLGEEKPGELIRSLGLDATKQSRLLAGTAREWLGLPSVIGPAG